ncbi:MAG: prepilin-type N-terminal cleavage/methylation domain-containing protein [Gemmataceae bacterium]|nr:prepilin-type N-terminal cleavage/methylation domain-containing protein [Gemmataceae bacterium]MDW8266973.1 prepilin-type N-terminal cleavage/methylation domain-containing protein [Gemmataceae bacterium]
MTDRDQRTGFTLIELLIVIAILAILVALTAGASIRVLQEQTQKNTELLIQKIDRMLRTQWQAALEQANADALPPGMDRVTFVRMRLAQEFPMNFGEARALYGPQLARAGAHGQGESAACLYMALQRNRKGSSLDAGVSFSPKELRDPVGDGLLEFTDYWGEPLFFFRRYPLGDKLSYLDGPDHNYPVPIVVSKGRDKMLGLRVSTDFQAMMILNAQQEQDNIYNDIRFGGRGGG